MGAGVRSKISVLPNGDEVSEYDYLVEKLLESGTTFKAVIKNIIGIMIHTLLLFRFGKMIMNLIN